MPAATARASSPARIPFRFHPRVFAALGADLVTNDVVAVMELVKNSYDAGARRVIVRFGGGSPIPEYLEIEDDGCGMSRDTVAGVWCVVATPYKVRNPMVGGVSGRRRVSGEKGLGRLSAARLGDEFRMWTRAPGEPCIEAHVSWPSLAKTDDSARGAVELTPREDGLRGPGTRIRVSGLKQEWTSDRIADLRANLSRLVPPFAGAAEFDLFLSPPGAGDGGAIRIEPDEFLNRPKYGIEGSVGSDGAIAASYRFAPLGEDGAPRECAINLGWPQVMGGNDASGARAVADSPRCGPFDFEIRAWDLDRDGTGEIAHRFELKRSAIRNAIRAHKGISVYRDGVLVLPKSDAARDWLGLDLRRLGRVGTRLSTNQIVGRVSISSLRNPEIRDTSDRERLIAGPALSDFRRLVEEIVKALEAQRDRDRPNPHRGKAMTSLFADLSPETMLERVRTAAREGAGADAVLPVVEGYAGQVEQSLETIRRRFVHYSQLATVGTIAQMLVHEIRNRTTSIGRFVISMKKHFDREPNRRLQTERDRADHAVMALESLSDGLSPLASRSYRRGWRTAVVEESIRRCLDLERARIRRFEVQCRVPDSRTEVAVDPGELDTVLLNLTTNALYWLSGIEDRPREIVFAVESDSATGRVEVRVEDSGPGIAVGDEDEVFLPGVTTRPGGIGMGLTVAREVVAAYDGKMSVEVGNRGARFFFDLPAGHRRGSGQ